MDMTRRGFLGGAISAVVVAATGIPASANVPVIVGDGVHDDAAGIQAMFDGQPFRADGETFIARNGVLERGTFGISRTLHMREGNLIRETTLKTVGKFEGTYMVHVDYDAEYPHRVSIHVHDDRPVSIVPSRYPYWH